jgi:outer membrane protein assembly factor BamB
MTTRRRAVAAAAAGIAAALGMSGCWLQPGSGATNARANTQEATLTRANVEGLRVAWEAGSDGTLSEPVVSGGRAYVTAFLPAISDDGPTLAVQAYDVDTGDLAWERDLLPADPTEEIFAHPVAVIDGALWVAYHHYNTPGCVGTLERLDPATGALLSEDTIGIPQSPVVESNGVVATVEVAGSRCNMQRLVVRDLETRAVEWVYPFSAGTGLSTPTFGDGRIIVAANTGWGSGHAVHAWDATGCGSTTCAPDWTHSRPGERATHIRPTAGPNGQAYVFVEQALDGATALTVRSLDTRTGQVRWSSATRYTGDMPPGTWGLAVAGGTLYVAGYEGSTLGPEPVTGRIDAYAAGGCGQAECSRLWSAELGEGVRPATPPAFAGDVVYVGTRSGPGVHQPSLVAVDAAGCGQATCAPVVEVPLVPDVGNPALLGADPGHVSVADGHVFLTWYSDLIRPTPGTLVAFDAS